MLCFRDAVSPRSPDNNTDLTTHPHLALQYSVHSEPMPQRAAPSHGYHAAYPYAYLCPYP